MSKELIRCGWCTSDPVYIEYHDKEWGKPLHDDHKLFELLLLEGAQAGLSWIQVLKRRDAYRKAFDHFDPEKIARYDARKKRQLMKDEGIIRNKLKIDAFVNNAQRYLDLMDFQDSFNDFIWTFTGHKVLDHKPRTLASIPTTTKESDAMSKELKKRGFKFVGSTICYAFMQACGMVNDHLEECFVRK